MRVSRSCKPLQHFYSLCNEILQEVSDAKYLGIQIELDWNKHISTVAARGQSKAFLNRNLKGCPKKLRDTVMLYADDTITSTHTSMSAARKYIQPYLHKVYDCHN